MYNLLVIQIST